MIKKSIKPTKEARNVEKESLSNVYKKQNNIGSIKLTSEGIEIQGKQLTNLIEEPLVIERFGEYTIVECRFVCEEFQSIPKHSSN